MGMKIVFMGTPEFAAKSLEQVINAGHQVAAVYTQPDKPVGRSQKLTQPPVKKVALEHGLAVRQPVKLRDGTVAGELRDIAPDLIVVVAYGRLLPKEILEIPAYGCVNIHASLLPKYRGAGPIQWCVVNGETKTGVTAMYMAEGMDTGDMIAARELEIGENETADELHDRLAVLGAECLVETLARFEEAGCRLPAVPQGGDGVSYAPIIEKQMAEIDFEKPAGQVHNLIRGMYSWPVAFTRLDGRLLKVQKAVKAEGFSGEPGVLLTENRLVIGCGEGAIELLEVQLEGGKRLSAGDFLRGHKVAKGVRLGR